MAKVGLGKGLVMMGGSWQRMGWIGLRGMGDGGLSGVLMVILGGDFG